MEHLAGVLRSLRADAAITQEDLAQRAGLSVRTVSDIERGLRKRLYRDTAEHLAAALGLSGEARTDFVQLARGRAVAVTRELDATFRRRYVAWHVDRVSALVEEVGHGEWYEVLDADEPNLTVALRWAADAGDVESLLQLAAGMWRYWQARGDLAIGRQWLERGLRAEPAASAAIRMTALWGLAWLSYQQGDIPSAARCGRELAALAEEADSIAARRNAATINGIVALARDDVMPALEQLEAALLLARSLHDPWLLATSMLNVGMGHIAARQITCARRCIGEASRRYAELGDERFCARSLGYLGWAAVVEGDVRRAERLFVQSLSAFDVLAEAKGVADALTGLATSAAVQGCPMRAAQLGGAAERVQESFAGRALPVERRIADRELARARRLAGEEDWGAAWTTGRALRVVDAVALALT
jgi:transcriptional regulator with XRE-family HTH domain